MSEIFHALPVASAIKRDFPHKRIIWVTDQVGSQLIDGNGDIDHIIAWKRNEWIRDFPYPHRTISVIWKIMGAIFELKRENIDIILDLEGSPISRFLAKRTGCQTRFGFAPEAHQNDRFKRVYTHLIPMARKAPHDYERNLLILKEIGINGHRMLPVIEIPEEDQKRANDFFEKKMPNAGKAVIGIYPGADYENRCWPLERFAEVADLLTERLGVNCLLLWFPGELNLIKSVEKNMITMPIRAYSASGKSMLALLKNCSLLLAADSALIQMANIVKTPVLALFGPTSPKRRGPIGPHDRVFQRSMTCVPCERLFCCNNQCMKAIEVKDIIKDAEEMLLER
ncbi:MAG: glycosyltransferase family 9 protein [bacterium]